ncbi:hypothetical protein QR680_019078 [Steinernema hermaphroditum]|uniref:G protein-coupled receptor n=1 Tax=Steinernema hermaphroditum TaxID=289476 RepID=A0AA39LS02_9BILA|nr:hypothetical protein QR680_019078 [Steinernema hermaphroditum]
MPIPLPVLHSTTIVTSLVTLVLNVRLIFCYYAYNKSDKRHFSTLFLCLYSQLCFNVTSIVFASQSLVGAVTGNWSPAGVFWAGDLTYSFTFAIVVCNFCIAADRIVAMRRPFQYASKYSRLCQNVCIVLMVISFCGACVRYSTGMKLDSPVAPAMGFLTRPDVLPSTSVARNILSFISIIATFFFLREVRLFLKKPHSSHVYRSIKKLNRVVLLQLVAEALLMILPDLMFPVSELLGGNPLAVIGPVSLTTTAFYTLAFSLLLTLKLRQSQMAEVTNVTSSADNTTRR